MSLSNVMRDEITLFRTVASFRDDIGGIEGTGETSLTVACYAEPYTSESQRTEAQPDRNTQIGEWLVVVGPDVDVTGWDRAELHGESMEIIAPPAPFRHARTGEEHHQELRLLRVE